MEENELMSFPKTAEVLGLLADDVRAGYIDQLKKHGHPTRYGTDRLHETITTAVEVDGKKFSVSLNMNHYWEYLEYGTGPARGRDKYWPNSAAIAKWIEVKPVIPRPDGAGRIPTAKQLTFLISRKIHDEGTKGTHGFETTRDAVLPMYIERIEHALSEDIGDYIKMFLTW